MMPRPSPYKLEFANRYVPFEYFIQRGNTIASAMSWQVSSLYRLGVDALIPKWCSVADLLMSSASVKWTT